MNCPGENTLLDLLEGGGRHQTPQLQAHLDGCSACRELLSEAQADRSSTDPESPPPDADPQGTRVDRPSRTTSVDSLPGKDPLIGQRIGDYEVIERIGSGGMGVVYRGVQPLIGKAVAIKIIRGEANADAMLMQRMLLEARAVNAIGHRGIVDIFGFGQIAGGRHYVVMEYLQGEPLDVWLKRQEPLSLENILDLLEQILAPLGAAHRAGVIHRDLKPSNLFRVRHEDGHEAVKLLDFGLAKRTIHDKSLTRTGFVVGTPAYMAPEQVTGDPVDGRTDLYSLGVLAYRLAGSRPFAEVDSVALMKAHLREEPRPLRRDRPDLPVALEVLLLRMLAKSPADRPASVEEVRAALQEFRGAPPTVESMPAVVLPAQTPRMPLRTRAVAAAAAAVSLVAVTLLAVAPWRSPVEAARSPPTMAEAERVLVAPEPEPPPAPPPSRTSEIASQPEVESGPAPEPERRPAVKPPRPAPVHTARAAPRPRTPTLNDERQRLLQRATAVRARLSKQDPLSTMFLDKAEADVRRARSRAQLRQAERTIQGVEEKFVSAGR